MSNANLSSAPASRNADGINEKELARAIAHSKHEHEHGHHSHDSADFHDYTQAVREYKKTFANKQQVIEQTPDPAVRDMLLPSSRSVRLALRVSAARIALWARAR